jgi:hypothetical protein
VQLAVVDDQSHFYHLRFDEKYHRYELADVLRQISCFYLLREVLDRVFLLVCFLCPLYFCLSV